MTKPYRLFIPLVLFLSLFLPAASARADMAPPPAPGVGGLRPLQFQPTNVQMTFERVEMEVLEISGRDKDGYQQRNRVAVNAWFVLHNQGDVDEKMEAVFPLDDINGCASYSDQKEISPSYLRTTILEDSFKITVDGIPVKVSKASTERPYKGSCEYLRWAVFDVTFPVDRDVLVKISYLMENLGGGDAIENLEYILETGAGWKGPISKGYIILRFPYMVEDNILEGTTPGYVKMYNEIYWQFENLEPTADNNILISFIEPVTWKKITDSRARIKKDPIDATAWRQLADSYADIAHFHGDNLRAEKYDQLAKSTYQRAIELNPESPELYVGYARYQYWYGEIWGLNSEGELINIMPEEVPSLLEKALRLDPSNEEAHDLVKELRQSNFGFDFTYPPTFTPTITLTPTITPTATITPPLTKTATLTASVTVTATAKAASSLTLTVTPSSTAAALGKATAAVEKSPVPATKVSAATGDKHAAQVVWLFCGLLLILFTLVIIFLIARRKPAKREP